MEVTRLGRPSEGHGKSLKQRKLYWRPANAPEPEPRELVSEFLRKLVAPHGRWKLYTEDTCQ